MHLEFRERHKIDDVIEEPSGLALGEFGKSLWTVSDSQRKLFEIDPCGRILNSFPIRNKGLEGITYDARTGRIYAVDEDASKIIVLTRQGEEVGSRKLRELGGFEQIRDDFDDVENNGLEGITFCEIRNCFYLLKEAKPGLLITVTGDLKSVSSFTRLGAANGFVDDNRASKKIDYSGICFDSIRDKLWIVSDRAKRIYVFDALAETVEQSFELDYDHRGTQDSVKKAEGIAIDPETSVIYLACDENRWLYVYGIRPGPDSQR